MRAGFTLRARAAAARVSGGFAAGYYQRAGRASQLEMLKHFYGFFTPAVVPAREGYAWACATVAGATALGFLLQRLPHANLSLVYLTGVLLVAARWGLGPSLLASLLSFLVYNFLFTPPFFTLTVGDEGDLATLFFFLALAALTGNLASRMRAEIEGNRGALRRLSTLHGFTERVAATIGAEEMAQALADHLAETLARPAAVLLSDVKREGGVCLHRSHRAAIDEEACAAVWRQGTLPTDLGGWRYLPLEVPGARLGLAAVRSEALDPERAELARHLCAHAAVAIERTRLAAELDEARVAAETEQLRSSLLSSVSHDLRTPLASIIGSTTTLVEYGESVPAASRRELLETVHEEARRLDRYIQNLLDMTRLDAGRLKLRRDWTDPSDVVATAITRLGPSLAAVDLHVDIEPGIGLLDVHAVLIEQALVNVLENAVRFSTPGARVDVEARALDEAVAIDVVDRGPGIAESERERVFESFVSVARGERSVGLGLGLSIARAVVRAHGGEIVASPGPGGVGTRMRITVPRGGERHET